MRYSFDGSKTKTESCKFTQYERSVIYTSLYRYYDRVLLIKQLILANNNDKEYVQVQTQKINTYEQTKEYITKKWKNEHDNEKDLSIKLTHDMRQTIWNTVIFFYYTKARSVPFALIQKLNREWTDIQH